MFQFILVFLLCFPIVIQSKGTWSYENIDEWPQFNRYCGGHSQSPINIEHQHSEYDDRLHSLHLIDTHHKRDQVHITNNGYSAQINIPHHYDLVGVQHIDEVFHTEQIHFHWGHAKDNATGSEHHLNGESFPLEMHLVTFSNRYVELADAVRNARAVAVIGALFKISNESNPYLQPILNTFRHIRNKDDNTILNKTFDLVSLLNDHVMRRYYRYDGSLTTPGCYESVVWSVLEQPLTISYAQLKQFRSLHDVNNKSLVNTYRTVQPLGTRKLYRNFQLDDHHAADVNQHTRQETSTSKNHGSYKFINTKIIIVLCSLLFMIN